MPNYSFLGEIATTSGSLDDSCFDEGKPVTAFALRQLARNANRWLTHEEHIHTIAYMSNTGGSTSHLTADMTGRALHIARVTGWTKISPPIYTRKMPGVDFGTATLSYYASHRFLFAATSSVITDPEQTAVECSTVSTAHSLAYSRVQLSSSYEDEVTYWIKGLPNNDYFMGRGTNINLVHSCDGVAFEMGTADITSDYTAQDTGAGRVQNWTTAGAYMDLRTTNLLTGARLSELFDVVGVSYDQGHVAVDPAPREFKGSSIVWRHAHVFYAPAVQVESINLSVFSRSV